MPDRATSPGRSTRVGLVLLVFAGLAPGELSASWTVDTSAASAHLGGPPSYTFSTLAEAQAFANANKNYGARLVPGGFDDVAGGGGGGGGGGGAPGGLNAPGLNAQQQLALAAAQAALPLLQQAARGIFAPQARAVPQLPSRSQAEIAAQQLYNSGMWYSRQNDYANALVEFQKALQRAPGNQQIMDAIARTQHQIDLAAQKAKAGGGTGVAPAAPPPPTAANALNLVNFGSDSSVVDLHDVANPAVDPAALKAASPTIPDDALMPKEPLDPTPGSGPVYRPPTKADLELQRRNADLEGQYGKLSQQAALDDIGRKVEQRKLESQIDDLFLQSTLDDYRAQTGKP